MKTIINKLVIALAMLVALGTTSCIGDLDIMPNDPNQLTPDKFQENPEKYIMQVMAKCYSSLAVSGQGGPNGSSDISGLDGGTSQYTRAIFMLNEFTTDEAKWKWPDEGVFDLVTGTWGAGNANIFGTYSRMYVHIAVCNDFMRLVAPSNLSNLGIALTDAQRKTVDQYVLEARALRAMSYYNIIDLFGNGGFIDETSAIGVAPVQKKRADLYAWTVAELEDVLAKFPEGTPVYGRIGKDGVEALLARLYLNAKVFTDGAEDGYAKCAEHCQNIINRHAGQGFNGSGLANHYMYLFCADNDEYMPGGGNISENEILWGIPYDEYDIQPYGGTTFLCKAGVADDKDNIPSVVPSNYGVNGGWTCMRATKQFADRFDSDEDVRWSMWNKEEDGFQRDCDEFGSFTHGYGVIKFTNLFKGENGEWSSKNGGKYDPTGKTPARAGDFPDTDLPLIRLADVYLMYAESNIVGGAGDAAHALKYVNFVRERAGVPAWSEGDMTADNILDERCRELYWENVRRTDLVRHNKFTGSNYVWNWKNNAQNGASMDVYRNLFPIPTNVIAAQPEFDQNTGY